MNFCVTLTKVKPNYGKLLKTLQDILLLLRDGTIIIDWDQIADFTQTIKLLGIEDINIASEAKSEEEDIVKVEIDDEKEDAEEKQDEKLHTDMLGHVDPMPNSSDNNNLNASDEDYVEYNPDPPGHDMSMSSEDERDEDFEAGGSSKKGKKGRPRNLAYGTGNSCPICGKDYSTRHIMLAHYHKKHTEKGREKLQQNDDLNITKKGKPRQKRGPREGPRKTSTLCPVCGNNYTTRQIMLQHYRQKHTEQGDSRTNRQALCGECGATFASYQTYLQHMKYKHTNQSFQCDQCELKFSQKSNLRTHISTVHDKILFYCDQCEESFKRKLLLDAHIRVVHQGIRMKCDHCEYVADRKDQLRRHYRYAHLKIKYSCEICDAQYAGNHNLKDHMARVHNIGTPVPNYRKNKQLKDEQL